MKVRYQIFSYKVLSGNRINFQSPYFVGRNFSIISDLSENKIIVYSNLRVRNNFNITIGKSGEVTIGYNCFFNNQCSINCLGKIEIGNNNQFGEAVLMYDHNHNYEDKTQLISNQSYKIGKIKIGDNCWIGSHVVILKDVVIGDNVIIGAGCIIHKSIPSNSVVMNQQTLLTRTSE